MMAFPCSLAMIEARALCAKIELSLPVRFYYIKIEKDKETGDEKKTLVYTTAPVHKAIRLAAKKYHPDRHPDASPDVIAANAEILKGMVSARQQLLKLAENGLRLVYPESMEGMIDEDVLLLMQEKLEQIKEKMPKPMREFDRYPDKCPATGKLICPICLVPKSGSIGNLKKHLSDRHKVTATFLQNGHFKRGFLKKIRTDVAGEGKYPAKGYYRAGDILRQRASKFNKAQLS